VLFFFGRFDRSSAELIFLPIGYYTQWVELVSPQSERSDPSLISSGINWGQNTRKLSWFDPLDSIALAATLVVRP
jgi:hypothetical protein